jgi:WD40 repeat protein
MRHAVNPGDVHAVLCCDAVPKQVVLLCVQIEPIADYHVGAIRGICSSPDGQHLLSCGLDGSVRVWAAAAGELVGKRDLGGKLTCCAAALGAADVPSKPVMALGSEAGVLR